MLTRRRSHVLLVLAAAAALATALTASASPARHGGTDAHRAGTAATHSVKSKPDTTPPTTPLRAWVLFATRTTLTVLWLPSHDDRGHVSYVLYRNGVVVGQTPLPAAIFYGLACGTTYRLG